MPVPEFLNSLTASAQRGELDLCIGRDDDLLQLETVLTGQGAGGVLLLGAPGVGKTELVRGLASHLAERKPEIEIFEVDLTSLEADTKYIGELQSKLNELLAFAAEKHGRVFFIDEFHSLIGIGTHDGKRSGIEQNLKSGLTSGRLRIIAATTEEEFKKFVAGDAALGRRFHRHMVREMDEAITAFLVRRENNSAKTRGLPFMTEDAVARVVEVAKIVYPDVARPACALKLFSEVRAVGRAAADTTCSVQGNPIDVLRSAVAILERSEGLEKLHDMLRRHINHQTGATLNLEVVESVLSELQAGRQ